MRLTIRRAALAATLFAAVLFAPHASAGRTWPLEARIWREQQRLGKVWFKVRDIELEALACKRYDIAVELTQARANLVYAGMHLSRARALAGGPSGIR